eukprot:71760-Rhodomonas_salina.1
MPYSVLNWRVVRAGSEAYLRLDRCDQVPTPVFICTSCTIPGTELACRALRPGLVGHFSPPRVGKRVFVGVIGNSPPGIGLRKRYAMP